MLLAYKKYLSWGHNCRFYPSCSEYTYLAVQKYGVFWGLLKGGKRLLRCGPWSKGGVDMLD